MLLLDAGNSRIKWAVVHGGAWLAQGALTHDEADRLRVEVAAHPGVARAVGTNVAGPRVAAAIAAAIAPLPLEWLRSSEYACGVHNGYADPAQLGADRWAALIGARSEHPGPCLVVTAGTATTVDVLDADGRFRGGLILPGEELMRRSLAGNTADLPFAEGVYRDYPRATDDAIVSGCLNAQAGAVERMFRLIADAPDALCVLSGGGAARLAPLLALPLRPIENLVLKGLAVLAGAGHATDDPGLHSRRKTQ